MRKRRVPIGVVIALMAITATLTLTLTYQYAMNSFNDQVKNVAERQKMYGRLYQIDNRVRDYFLFPVDDAAMFDAIAEGYVNGLKDNGTKYLPQSLCLKTQQQIQGLESGIGMEIAMYGTTRAVVTRVIHSGPAQLAGVQAGDFLVGINDIVLDDTWTLERIEKLLAGDAGTELILKVQRTNEEGIPEDLTFTLTRREYETQTVTYRIIEGLGYVRIYSFNERTDEEFREALVSLVNTGINGLIIDVRNNGGGVMESAAAIADTLLPAGTIVSYSGRDGVKKPMYISDGGQTDLPLAVLINQNSASASEMLAAAVQDYNKGRIVGVQSYGKGTVQELHTFSDGSGLYLTTAYFYPPFSSSFHGVGITPDIKVEMSYTGSLDLLDETTDLQLSAAVNLLNQSGQFAPVDPELPTTSDGASSDETASGDSASGDASSGEDTTSGNTSSDAASSGESASSASSQVIGYAEGCSDCIRS
ncbi:MAG: S41 family peptidase [Clostridia bacterium]|nr:S41 family peptidase [Clostridia bacterium]